MTTERIHKGKGKGGHGSLSVTEQTVEELAQSYDRPLPAVNGARERGTRPEQSGMRTEWYGGLRHSSEAVELVSKGWTDGAKRLQELQRSLAIDVPAAQSRRRQPRWSDDGDTLDPDRAMAGQWDTAFRTTRREWTSGSTVVELFVGWGGTWDRSSEEMFWSGAQMLVIADVLEGAGYSARLTAMSTSDIKSGTIAVSKVLVKDAGEALRIDALAGVVCHVGIFRTLGLRAVCSSPFAVDEGYGRTATLASVRPLLELHGEWPTEDSIIVPHAYDRASAVANIQSALAGLQAGRAA